MYSKDEPIWTIEEVDVLIQYCLLVLFSSIIIYSIIDFVYDYFDEENFTEIGDDLNFHFLFHNGERSEREVELTPFQCRNEFKCTMIEKKSVKIRELRSKIYRLKERVDKVKERSNEVSTFRKNLHSRIDLVKRNRQIQQELISQELSRRNIASRKKEGEFMNLVGYVEMYSEELVVLVLGEEKKIENRITISPRNCRVLKRSYLLYDRINQHYNPLLYNPFQKEEFDSITGDTSDSGSTVSVGENVASTPSKTPHTHDLDALESTKPISSFIGSVKIKKLLEEKKSGGFKYDCISLKSSRRGSKKQLEWNYKDIKLWEIHHLRQREKELEKEAELEKLGIKNPISPKSTVVKKNVDKESHQKPFNKIICWCFLTVIGIWNYKICEVNGKKVLTIKKGVKVFGGESFVSSCRSNYVKYVNEYLPVGCKRIGLYSMRKSGCMFVFTTNPKMFPAFQVSIGQSYGSAIAGSNYLNENNNVPDASSLLSNSFNQEDQVYENVNPYDTKFSSWSDYYPEIRCLYKKVWSSNSILYMQMYGEETVAEKKKLIYFNQTKVGDVKRAVTERKDKVGRGKYYKRHLPRSILGL